MMNIEERRNKQTLQFAHKYTQLVTLIERSKTITDLVPILYKLLPLSELKRLLLQKLTKLNVSKNNTESLHKLYYHCIPLDEIFSDDVLCHVIQFLSSPSDDDADYMYNKLPVINKHFNKLMREKTCIYQQYKICVSLNDDLWKRRKSVLVQISHQTKSIQILDPHQTKASGVITPPCRFGKKYNMKFEILNLDDMNTKCPFIWWSIKKWHIISSSIHANRLYSHNLYQYYNNKRVDRVNRMYNNNDFSGYVSPTDSLELTPTYKSNRRSSFFAEGNKNDIRQKQNFKQKQKQAISRMDILTENNSIMKQLLDKAAVHIKSIQIDDNDSNLQKPALKNFFWLNKLFHIRSLSHDIISFYSIKNLCYLDLIETIHSKTFEILRDLCQLLVLKIDLNDTYLNEAEYSKTENESDNNSNEQQWLVTLPMNVEFIQIQNFSNASSYLLNFELCKNIIAVLFKDSKIFEWDFSDYYNTKQSQAKNNAYRSIAKCIIWPQIASPIECVLFDDGIETRSIDNWYQYFEAEKMSAKLLPIKYCRYRMMPTALTYRDCIAVPAFPQSPMSFNEELVEQKTECDPDLHSYAHDSNAATVDDNFSLQKSITIKEDYDHLEEEEEKLYLPLTPPSVNKIKYAYTNNKKTIAIDREISWTESSCNITDSATTTATGGAANNYQHQHNWVHSASLDEEEEMKGTLPLTKDILERYMLMGSNNNNSNNNNGNNNNNNNNISKLRLQLPNDMMEEHLFDEKVIVKINEILKRNVDDEFCVILDDQHNDGLLWKLLLHNKYLSRSDGFIQGRIAMYKQWFNMNIAQWIYHLGFWMANDPSLFLRRQFYTAVPLKQRLSINTNNNNNPSTTRSQPNVPRRSATINTSSPTVSSSPSVVDSLELYLQ